ncbi:MAG: hypothetical protein HRU46_18100 [Verrucomicrobiales bacterium]|nr:hypothetical protein [Verrucomicrobiales bacterium]
MNPVTKIFLYLLAIAPFSLLLFLEHRAESFYSFATFGKPIFRDARVIEVLPEAVTFHRVTSLRTKGISFQSFPPSHPAVSVHRKLFTPIGTPSPEAEWGFLIAASSLFALVVLISMFTVSANTQATLRNTSSDSKPDTVVN